MRTITIGYGHTKFGKLKESLEELIIDVGKQAIKDAGIEPRDIDLCFLGMFSGSFTHQEHIAPVMLKINKGLRFKPCFRIENGGASGSSAVVMGTYAIRTGQAKRVLVVGVEKMTGLDIRRVRQILYGTTDYNQKTDGNLDVTKIFADISKAHHKMYGTTELQLAKVALKNYSNALNNPNAHIKKNYDLQFFADANPDNIYIAEPLKVTDCFQISDGAAAVVITDDDTALTRKSNAVEIASQVLITDYLSVDDRELIKLEGAKVAFELAFRRANMTIEDINVAELHDAYTINELMVYEAMGLCSEGQGGRVIDEGRTLMTGQLPVNPSGGLLAQGHPLGATGVSQIVNIAKQILGKAGDMQVPKADVGITYNMGGIGATNVVSILKKFS